MRVLVAQQRKIAFELCGRDPQPRLLQHIDARGKRVCVSDPSTGCVLVLFCRLWVAHFSQVGLRHWGSPHHKCTIPQVEAASAQQETSAGLQAKALRVT